MNKRLSICIPVYNCADYLPEALNSILGQTKKEIEVIVFDGGSTDNTQELMKGYLSNWPNLRYERAEQRGGIDLDMAKCVDFANGEYCWLFSGDDVMRPGSIDAIFAWLDLGLDVYISKHTICDKNLKVLHGHPVFKKNMLQIADLSVSSERIKWFESAATTEALFSFMSGLIVNTKKWRSTSLPALFTGSCWGHVARLFELSHHGLRVCYIPQILLDQRGENDSFMQLGYVNRFRIAIEGYGKMGKHYYGENSKEAFHIRRVLRNEFSVFAFMKAKYFAWHTPTLENRKILDEIVSDIYQDFSIINVLKKYLYYLFPPPIFIVLQPIYRPLKSVRRFFKYHFNN